MGSVFGKTRNDVNFLHENIEILMDIKPDQVKENTDRINFIMHQLMNNYSYERVTESQLLRKLRIHIEEYNRLNECNINEEEYVNRKYHHLLQFLTTYYYHVMCK